jgi:hypothetical protein
MGCGFVAMVPADQASAAVELLSSFHPGTAVIGQLTDEAEVVELLPEGIRATAGSDTLAGS